MTAEARIAELLDAWAAAVRAHDMEGVLRHHSPDIVMFDVPAPLQAQGIDAYRDTWTLYFQYEGSRKFTLLDTRIVAGKDVAWVHALLRCTVDDAPAGRLSIGLRLIDGAWVVEHEHHSFPLPLTETPAP